MYSLLSRAGNKMPELACEPKLLLLLAEVNMCVHLDLCHLPHGNELSLGKRKNPLNPSFIGCQWACQVSLQPSNHSVSVIFTLSACHISGLSLETSLLLGSRVLCTTLSFYCSWLLSTQMALVGIMTLFGIDQKCQTDPRLFDFFLSVLQNIAHVDRV